MSKKIGLNSLFQMGQGAIAQTSKGRMPLRSAMDLGAVWWSYHMQADRIV